MATTKMIDDGGNDRPCENGDDTPPSCIEAPNRVSMQSKPQIDDTNGKVSRDQQQHASSQVSSSVGPERLGNFLNNVKQSQLRHRKVKGHGPIDTVSYERYDTELWNERKAQIVAKERGRTRQSSSSTRKICFANTKGSGGGGSAHQRQCQIWLRLTVFGIGFATSCIGYFIIYTSEKLAESLVPYLGLNGEFQPNPWSYARYVGFSVLFALMALLPIALIRPVAAGSGIAEAKAVLNGIKIPCCTELASAACKAVSLIFAEATALPIGLEGPLIFIGMSIGENFNRLVPRKFPELRSWRQKRDLAAVGTAAGVAAAFLSPIGGILFAAEEGASFVSTKMLWQCFAAGITVVIFEYFWLVIAEDLIGGKRPFAFQLARFSGISGQNTDVFQPPSFAFYEYFVMICVGAVGGIIGACFVEASKRLTKFRMKYIQTFRRKVVEMTFLAAFAATLLFWLPTLPKVSKCHSVDLVQADDEFLVQFDCAHDEYNDLATLLRTPLSVAINLLFYESSEAFSAISCVVAGLTIFLLLLLTFGSSTAIGIFIPLLYVGAAIGRAFGLVYKEFDVRTYAILGATASLNGVVRVLISLPAIMMETTTISSFVSPLMIVCLVSRYVGNGMFRSEGIYDEILKIREIPFLEEEPPKVTKRLVLRARDVMSIDPVHLQLRMQVAEIFEILQEYSHLDFPVIDPSKGGRLVGSISRATLKAILWKKALSDCRIECEERSVLSEGPNLSYDKIEFDRLENISDADLFKHYGCEERLLYVSLDKYITLSPITFEEDGSAERAFELFRTLGLRQLIIIDSDKRPIGVVTRFDLKALEEEEREEREEGEEEEDCHEVEANIRASNGDTVKSSCCQ